MSNEFRDAIASVIDGWEPSGLSLEDCADRILGMPEMQAICAALQVALDETPMGCPYLLKNGAEGAYGPNTCMSGCSDEPICMTYSYPVLRGPLLAWIEEEDRG